MELETRSYPNSFIDDADIPERRLYRTWPTFHIYIFGGISFFEIKAFFGVIRYEWEHLELSRIFCSQVYLSDSCGYGVSSQKKCILWKM